MSFLRSVVAASVVAGAVVFAPAPVLPSVTRNGAAAPLTVVMNGGTGLYREVDIRGAVRGQAGKPPVKPDPLAIDLELVQGTKRVDVVDISYKKPPSSFFSTDAVVPPTPKPTAAAPKPYARAYGAKEWDEARRQGSFGSDGEPVSLAPSDIAEPRLAQKGGAKAPSSLSWRIGSSASKCVLASHVYFSIMRSAPEYPSPSFLFPPSLFFRQIPPVCLCSVSKET